MGEGSSDSPMKLTDLPTDVLQRILKIVCSDRQCVESAKWAGAAAMSCRAMQDAASREFWLWFLLQFTGLKLPALSVRAKGTSLSELCYSMARAYRKFELHCKAHSQFISPLYKEKATKIATLLLSSEGQTIFVPPMTAHYPQIATPQMLQLHDGTLHLLSAIGGNGVYVADCPRKLLQISRQVLKKEYLPNNVAVYMKPTYFGGLVTLLSAKTKFVKDHHQNVSSCNIRDPVLQQRTANILLVTRAFLKLADEGASKLCPIIRDIIENIDVLNYTGEHYDDCSSVHQMVERLSRKEFKTIFYRERTEISGVPSAVVNGKYAANEIVAC